MRATKRSGTRGATDVLNREYLEIRCHLIGIAASLDRIDRAADASGIDDDPRLSSLHAAVQALIDGKPDRARRLQMIFSDAYDENWRKA